MLSQIFILSNRGDVIITRDFRGDLKKETHDLFFHNVKSKPPVFRIENTHFLYIHSESLYLVATSISDTSPAFVLEMLSHIAGAIKDLCGALNEETIRKNFVYVYEIIDEVVDFGYPQNTATEQIIPYLVNEPVSISPDFTAITSLFSGTAPSSAAHRPVLSKKFKNEIFADVTEKVSIVFNRRGGIVYSNIDGCILMKSYLAPGTLIKMMLNEDLRDSDHWNFHQCVDLREFSMRRILNIKLPSGEFNAMNYRLNQEFDIPFRLTYQIDVVTAYKVECSFSIRSCFADTKHALGFKLQCKVPVETVGVTFDLPTLQDQKVKFEGGKIEWNVNKFPGGGEFVMKAMLSVSELVTQRQIGPVCLSFELPSQSTGAVNIKSIKLDDSSKSEPYKWVRYLTKSSSYIFRLN